jgi:hypothetical protein
MMRHLLWGVLLAIVYTPLMILAVVAVALEYAERLITKLSQSLWAVTGEKIEARRSTEIDKAHEILPIDEIKLRLGEDPGQIIDKSWE